ncbi:MAG: hypothetical protein QOF77_133 [Solirubrobacteraceae bacterium]|nr:hypothetical protein [Solirubrobacteraceae bacterium]
MRRFRVLGLVVVVAVVAVFLLTRGGGESPDAKQVRATLLGYTQASAQKDYATICRRYLAANILDKMREIHLPCKMALARGLAGLQSPTLVVKGVKVDGTTALADVHTAAAGQPPLDGTIELVKAGGRWQIRSQTAQTEPATKTTKTAP